MNLEKAQQIYRALINNPFWKDYNMTNFFWLFEKNILSLQHKIKHSSK